MRELKKEEIEKIHKKLKKMLGDNFNVLFNDDHTLQLHKEKIFHINKNLLKNTSNISNSKLIAVGTQIGKFTKTKNFYVTITALNLLNPLATHRIWLKNSAEMNFLYGKNAIKSHIHKISENIPSNATVFVYNQNNTPLGFGVTSKSSIAYGQMGGKAIFVMNQADTGEYLRNEMII